MKKKYLFLLLFSLHSKLYSQSIKENIDSISRIVKLNNFNSYDNNGKKTGYWIEHQLKSVFLHQVEIFVYSGLYGNGKKIGTWEERVFSGPIRQKEFILDRLGNTKLIITYYPNGKIESESSYVMDPKIVDSIGTINEKGEPVFKKILGKFIKNGLWCEYFENEGGAKVIGQYNNGIKYGKWYYFDSRGNLLNIEKN